MKEIRIHRRGAERIDAGHPWVYRSDILEAPDDVAGQVVRVLDGRNRRLGCAHYSAASEIALRMLPYETKSTDVGFFRRLIHRAQQYRDLVVGDAQAYRLIHAEADLLPGLVIDRYGDYFSIQTLTQGMEHAKPAIVAALDELYSPSGVAERNDSAARSREKLPRVSGMLRGEAPSELAVTLNGLQFGVDLVEGQKTGLFLDQRENWSAAAEYAKGKALDCFCYSGGFAMNLARRCDTVEAVDSSAPALERAWANARRNGLENIEVKTANVFDLLAEYGRGRRKYDIIVLDPPAFAKSRRHVEAARRAYKGINLAALRLLDRGGVLVTCSCSHHISEGDLLGAVAEAALDCGKRLRIIERRTQSRDHPIALTIPETHYLKCIILQVQ